MTRLILEMKMTCISKFDMQKDMYVKVFFFCKKVRVVHVFATVPYILR